MTILLERELGEPKLLACQKFEDSRGWFRQTFSVREWAELGISFVQDNESMSVKPGTIRGLHYQRPPHAQGKLLRVAAGAIFDVAVDIRLSSPRFGQAQYFELDASEEEQLWIPAGFAHGFCTLKPETLVQYKVTSGYEPTSERSLRFDDPALEVPWPVEASQAVLSEKDQAAPALSELKAQKELFA